MPSVYQLFRRDNGASPFLQTVDRQLCQELDLPFDEKEWVADWHNHIGFMLAIGKSFPQITNTIKKNIAEWQEKGKTDYVEWSYTLLRINHFLHEHYTVDAWKEWK